MRGRAFDYVVIGAGIGGLVTAALLAHQGLRVCLLERHSKAGGYGHSFSRRGYTFCAELHYLWNCGLDQEFGRLVRFLGLEDRIRFEQLDPDGFDRLRFPSFRYDFVNGLQRNVHRLAANFPQHACGIRHYFEILAAINKELYDLPLTLSRRTLLRHPWKFRHVLQYRNWTTEMLFERLGFSLPLRSILAGQSGDLGLPPSQASLLIQAGITCGYDAGAYVPATDYTDLFDSLVGFIRGQNGCDIRFNQRVTALDVRGERVMSASTRTGRTYHADRFLFNGDPKQLRHLVPSPLPAAYDRRLDYPYSASSFTVYLGLRNLQLERYGFGNWNVWHYQHDDINRCYAEQLDQRRLDNPMLFMSTPTLHHKHARIAPPGCHQLVICTPCNYAHFLRLRQRGLFFYQREKAWVTERILDQIERRYVPGLRRHLDLVIAGTPLTNERFVMAPEGNAYGARLTPRHVNLGKLDYRTPFHNLWLVGATAGAPSFAGGTHFARLLAERLAGQPLLDAAPAHRADRPLAA